MLDVVMTDFASFWIVGLIEELIQMLCFALLLSLFKDGSLTYVTIRYRYHLAG